MNAALKYRCPGCRQLHNNRIAAQKCCTPIVREVYVCRGCNAEYMSSADAGYCCPEKLDRTETVNFGSVGHSL